MERPRSVEQVAPAVAAAAATLSLAGCTAAVALYWWTRSRGLQTYELNIGDLVLGTLFPSVGALLVTRQPRNAAGWVLTAGALVGIGVFAHQYAFFGGIADPGALPLVGLATWLAAWTFGAYWIQPGLLALLFPDGKPASPRWRTVAQVILGVAVIGTLAAAFRPDGNVEDLGLANPLGIAAAPVWPFAAVMTVAAFSTLFVGGALGVIGLVSRLRGLAGRERAQTLWLLTGFTAFLVLPLSSEVVPVAGSLLFAVGLACIPAAITIAVVRHQLLDIELVLNRTLVAAMLTGAGLVAYALIVTLAGAVAPDRRVASLVAAAVALAAAALRSSVQRAVDRWLFGARRDPYTVVDMVGAEVAAATDPALAVERLVDVLRRSLRLPFAAVEPIAADLPVASSGRPVTGVEEIPVVWEGRRLATLRVGHRHRGERLRPEERSALADVARRAGSVLHAYQLSADLQRSREHLVAAREEERRRLRRDLHDGLGPALAGVALQLDGLHRRVNGDDALAARTQDLSERVRSAVKEVRRIIDGLRPATLDELGLAEALRRMGLDGHEARVSVDVADALPPLPAAVEVAVYRIVAEGVTNALRHSHASTIRVDVRMDGTAVQVQIRDDGEGFETTVPEGVGLASMHERAAEVGGSVEIRSSRGEGTLLLARLPTEQA